MLTRGTVSMGAVWLPILRIKIAAGRTLNFVDRNLAISLSHACRHNFAHRSMRFPIILLAFPTAISRTFAPPTSLRFPRSPAKTALRPIHIHLGVPQRLSELLIYEAGITAHNLFQHTIHRFLHSFLASTLIADRRCHDDDKGLRSVQI